MNSYVVCIIAFVFIFLIVDGIRDLLTPRPFITDEDMPRWQKIKGSNHESLRQVGPEPKLYKYIDKKGTCHRTLVDETFGWRLPHSPSSPPHA